MMRVVEDILLLTRLEYESEVFRPEPFDLVEFFRELHEHSKLLAEPKRIGMRLHAPSCGIGVRADRVHLRRLFFNLIDNAIKFSPENGSVDLRIWTEDHTAKVSVTDRGVGISEDVLPKIFGKFFHLDPRPERPESGAGLGLSMAMAIAKAHGGGIDVQSRSGEGAAFTVCLPMH